VTEAAYVLRIAPSGGDRVPEALATDHIIIGWANAEGLLNASLSWEEFREIIRVEYYSEDANLRGAITRDDCSARVRGADPLRQKRAHAQRPASQADRR
jgi:hypothetical protein